MRFRLLPLIALLAAFPAAFAQTAKVKIGQLGQATEAAKIHRSASSKSRVYYRVKPFEYLVVEPSAPKGWVKVYMQNRTYGYVKADVVAVLPYEVTMDGPTRNPAQLASRSTGRTTAANGQLAAAVAGYGLNFVGTPYKWGGNDLQGGIDCSGFVKELYEKAGVNLPRTAAQQYNVGKPITKLQDLQAGDRLYFWDSKRNLIGHTGIYLQDGYFVHSSSTRGGVATDHLMDPKWRRILVAARR